MDFIIITKNVKLMLTMNSRIKYILRMGTDFGRLYSNRKLWLILILAVALVIRIVYLYQSSQNSPFFFNPSIDALYHHLMAIDFANGELQVEGPFFRAPLYPVLLGMLYLVFGVSIFIASLAGHLLGVVTILFIFLIGERFFNTTTAVIASLIYILYYPALYFEGQLLVDTLFSTLTIASLYFFLRGQEENGNSLYLGISGLVLGLAAITRANILIFYIPAILWLLLKLKKPKLAGIFITAAVIPIIPVTAVNLIMGDDAVLIASQGGINFYIGNNPEADGMTARFPETGVTWQYEDCKFYAEKETGEESMKPSEVSQYYYFKGFDFIIGNPYSAVILFLKKIYLSLNNYEISNNQNLCFTKRYASVTDLLITPFALILALAVIGKTVMGLRRRESLLMWLLMLSIWITMILFFVTSRFRLPLIPYLSIFAGYGAYSIYSTFNGKLNLKKLLTPFAFGAIAVLISLSNFTNIDKFNFSQAYYNLGNIYLRNGEWQKAKEQYEQAMESNPRVSLARLNIGNIFFYTDQYDSAEYYYRQELKHHPGESRAYLNLSTINLLKGDYRNAMIAANDALAHRPNEAGAVSNLVQAMLFAGDTTSAVKTSRNFMYEIEEAPRLLLALGSIYLQRNQLDSAKMYYRRIMEISEETSLVSEYNLGEIYSKDLPFSADPTGIRKKAEYNIATIEIREGNLDSALGRLESIIESDSLFVQAWINAGLIYDYRRDYSMAEYYLKRAAEISPDNPAIFYNLGLTYAKSNRFEAAKRNFTRALQVDSTFFPAAEKLELMKGLMENR
ncbi:MAG: tetratricopeptide repeat protein [candidate division Zixibacteria bacterium]|nr:tetratricopeptide repeat protein [candidate division Zixibacteria bacterium]